MIRAFGRAAAALMICTGLLAGTVASAQDRPDSQALTEEVIRAQLAAMADGDAALAYSFAAPSIRNIFPSSASFMAMVRSGYGALIAPAEFAFDQFEVRGDRAIQILRIVDRQGRLWRAIYRMQLLEDGTWRIAGCMLEEIPGGSV